MLSLAVVALRKNNDAFSADPTARFAGRRFRIVVPLDQQTNDYGSGWSYDKDHRRLNISAFTSSGYTLFHTEKAVGSYVGSNSFGVKKRVTKYVATEIALTVRGQPKEYGSYDTSIAAEPDVARQAAKDLELVLEGEIVTGSGGGTTGCVTNEAGATIDDPTEVSTTTCSVTVRIDRISIKQIHETADLAEWRMSATTEPK